MTAFGSRLNAAVGEQAIGIYYVNGSIYLPKHVCVCFACCLETTASIHDLFDLNISILGHIADTCTTILSGKSGCCAWLLNLFHSGLQSHSLLIPQLNISVFFLLLLQASLFPHRDERLLNITTGKTLTQGSSKEGKKEASKQAAVRSDSQASYRISCRARSTLRWMPSCRPPHVDLLLLQKTETT